MTFLVTNVILPIGVVVLIIVWFAVITYEALWGGHQDDTKE